MAAVNRILFVCSGNAARSPMAAEILRSLGVTRSRLRHVVVESAGTHASDGERPFDGAIEAMEEIGLSIGGHRARLLTPDLASSYDLILTMDRDQARTVRALGARVEVAALGDYAGIPGDVEAPCDSREECAACRDHLQRLVAGVVRRLERAAPATDMGRGYHQAAIVRGEAGRRGARDAESSADVGRFAVERDRLVVVGSDA